MRDIFQPIKRISAEIVAGAMLFIMAVFLVFEASLDSATMDEAAHIPAGYSYVLKKDMRLNPEHPPLVKFLSGLSVRLFVRNVNFPDKLSSWTTDVNSQWNFGFDFLYRSGNDADSIVDAARIPAILLTLTLGALIFIWAQELVGSWWALIPTAMFAFSPNFIGHGHLVTTDIGSTLGILLGLYAFVKFLEDPSTRRITWAGIALGIALLFKFTTALLLPVFAILAVLWALIDRKGEKPDDTYYWWLGRLLVIGVVAFVLVWFVYVWHVWSYPEERQLRDAQHILTSYGIGPLKNLDFWLIRQPLLRPLGQYVLGFLMNLQRAAGGHTTYFLGEVSASGWKTYFPIVYLIKEPVPILLILVFALFAGIKKTLNLIPRRKEFIWGKVLAYVRDHRAGTAMALFAVMYWSSSIASNLNIGLRHIFPTLPLFYLLATPQIKELASRAKGWLLAVGLAIIWLFAEMFVFAPHHLAYFNELIGGPANAYKYVVDSNLDWGQSLGELREFVVKNNIPKIKVDYFGGGDAQYFLGGRFEPLNRDLGPQKGWLAISTTFLQGERGRPAPGFDQPYGRYRWLDKYEPVAKIGYSIFVYYIE